MSNEETKMSDEESLEEMEMEEMREMGEMEGRDDETVSEPKAEAPKLNILCEMADPGDGSIEVIATKDGSQASIFYNFGKDLDEMIALFGADVAYSYAKGQMVIRLQAGMRSRMKSGGDIIGLATEFVPGVALSKAPQDMGKATENYFMSLSAEEQDAMIEKLMEKKGF